jgi:hypothetical protein
MSGDRQEEKSRKDQENEQYAAGKAYFGTSETTDFMAVWYPPARAGDSSGTNRSNQCLVL